MKSVERPVVQNVRGRSTIYVSGQRLLLPARFAFGTEWDGALPDSAIGRLRKDGTKATSVRVDLLSERTSNALGDMFAWLFPKRFSAALLTLLAGMNLLAIAAVRLVPTAPGTPWDDHGPPAWLCIAVLLVLHEIGHVAMARRLDIRVDSIGAGIHIIFPALYSRISLVTLLDWRERIDVFLAGIVVQSCMTPVLVLLLIVSGAEVAGNVLTINLTLIAFNLLPVLRLDGYRVMQEILLNRMASGHARWLQRLLRVMTLGFLAVTGYLLTIAFAEQASQFAEMPNVVDGLACTAYLVLLCLLLRFVPGWLRNPYG